jgi:hypothetical protein
MRNFNPILEISGPSCRRPPPERRDLAWRYGTGPEILDPVRRTAEIGNWLQEAAKISSS